MTEDIDRLDPITVRADSFRGKPMVRDMRIAIEHILAMLAAGDRPESVLAAVPAPDAEDVPRPGLLFAHRAAAGEHTHDRAAFRAAA